MSLRLQRDRSPSLSLERFGDWNSRPRAHIWNYEPKAERENWEWSKAF